MLDLSKTIAPRSDQLNADDLIAGPKLVVLLLLGAVLGAMLGVVIVLWKVLLQRSTPAA